MYTIAKHRCRKTGIRRTVRNLDRGLFGGQSCRPVRDPRVEIIDGRIRERRWNEFVNLEGWSTSINHSEVVPTIIFMLGFEALIKPTILVYESMIASVVRPWNASLVPSMNCTTSGVVDANHPSR